MRDDPLRDRVVLVIEDDDEYRDIIRRLVASDPAATESSPGA
jgi:hypothetical protein